MILNENTLEKYITTLTKNLRAYHGKSYRKAADEIDELYEREECCNFECLRDILIANGLPADLNKFTKEKGVSNMKLRESYVQGTCPICGEKIYSDEGCVKVAGVNGYVHDYHCTEESLEAYYDFADKFWATHDDTGMKYYTNAKLFDARAPKCKLKEAKEVSKKKTIKDWIESEMTDEIKADAYEFFRCSDKYYLDDLVTYKQFESIMFKNGFDDQGYMWKPLVNEECCSAEFQRMAPTNAMHLFGPSAKIHRKDSLGKKDKYNKLGEGKKSFKEWRANSADEALNWIDSELDTLEMNVNILIDGASARYGDDPEVKNVISAIRSSFNYIRSDCINYKK